MLSKTFPYPFLLPFQRKPLLRYLGDGGSRALPGAPFPPFRAADERGAAKKKITEITKAKAAMYSKIFIRSFCLQVNATKTT